MSTLKDILDIRFAQEFIKPFRQRVKADGSTLKNESTTKRFYDMAKSNQTKDSIKFAWFGESASKIRTSGINSYVSKAYSAVTTNDAVQTTDLLQPNLSGNIAPNEKYCLQNANGQSRFMTHPTISFAANEAWSVSTCFNSFACTYSSAIAGNGINWDKSKISFNFGNEYVIGLYTENSGIIKFNTFNKIHSLIGKLTVLTITYDGTYYKLYINGIFIQSVSSNDGRFIFSKIYFPTSESLFGKIYAHIIRSVALTPAQISTEYNFFRSLYPEIETVNISGQQWATSNCDMVCTPMGNLIANVTDNTAWSNSQATYDSTYTATAGTIEQKTYAAVKAAAMWSYYNNDPSIGSIYGKLYNWFAVKLLQMDIDYYNTANPATPWGYRVPTDTDFTTLQTNLGGSAVAGGKMKVAGTAYWLTPNTGANNSSGFSALPSGNRTNGVYGVITQHSQFWTITESDANNAILKSLYNGGIDITSVNINKSRGESIRLIK